MSKHGILSFKPQPRLERRGQDGQRETEKPDHPASLGNFITSSTRTKFSVHTGDAASIVMNRVERFLIGMVTAGMITLCVAFTAWWIMTG
jgi:hypothetical protein